MWPLNNNTASDLEDISSKGNNLTNNGTVTFTASGVRGNVATFNGTTQYLSCTDATCGGTSKLDYSGSGGWSVGAWVNPTASSKKMVVSKFGNSGQYGYVLFVLATNKPAFTVSSNGSALTNVEAKHSNYKTVNGPIYLLFTME